MSINSILRKEGITVIEQLDTLKVNTIAKSISNKLCLALPDHNLNRTELFASFSRINMYIANMPNDLSGAKYFYKNNSIYFNEYVDSFEFADVAMHECIHYLQEFRDSSGNVIRMGLYDGASGKGLNEASVQLMASESNMFEQSQEKYFDISLNTISPNYYPLECALVNEITYFTGTYPLYHSTLNSNNVFKNTFIAKSSKKIYNTIIKNLDQLLAFENDLNYFISELQYEDKKNTIRLLNRLILSKKKAIASLFFTTQNLIIKSFFTSEFDNIRDIADVKTFKQRFYDFKDVIGTSDSYEFYNNFYRHMMEALENKKEHIEQFGPINLFEKSETSLVVVDNTKGAIAFIHTLFKKIKKVFNTSKAYDDINDVY